MTDVRALQAKAASGDVAAQFELATVLDRAGKRAEATTWLEAAANAGHTEALTLLAVGDLQGIERPRDVERALARLTDAVLRGGNGARRLLAVLTAIGTAGAPPDWRSAVEFVIEAAKAGDFQALRELAFLIEMAAPGSRLAEDVLRHAALKGDGLAAFAAMRRQTLRGRTLASERAFGQWREAMQRIGHPFANLVSSVVSRPETAPTAPPPPIDWHQVTAVLTAPPGVKHSAPDATSDTPYIRRFGGLLSVEECEYLIGLTARLLVPAEVFDRTSGVPQQSQVRTNSVAALWPANQDLVVHAINLRLAAAAGLPAANGELTNVLMYQPGQEYRAHYDFFPLEVARAHPSGQRIRTLLVYLNYDYGGGETQFISAGKKIKGGVGDAVLFHNCDASGAPYKATLHAGLPVTSGQKWLLSKWYREKTFNAEAS
jgi:prolyl 4-hydroxylase